MDAMGQIYEGIRQDPMNLQFTQQGMKPVFMASANARILIIGQAPGQKTQEKGMVFQDRSGNTLRSWLGVDETVFYESGLFSVLPIDFYFPGKGKTGDLPPRTAFAKKWHPPLLALMPDIRLTILIGSYAQKYYLKGRMKRNLTETVSAFEEYLPDFFVLVHPSPLNFRWFHHNEFFEKEAIPILRHLVKEILEGQDTTWSQAEC